MRDILEEGSLLKKQRKRGICPIHILKWEECVSYATALLILVCSERLLEMVAEKPVQRGFVGLVIELDQP